MSKKQIVSIISLFVAWLVITLAVSWQSTDQFAVIVVMNATTLFWVGLGTTFVHIVLQKVSEMDAPVTVIEKETTPILEPDYSDSDRDWFLYDAFDEDPYAEYFPSG